MPVRECAGCCSFAVEGWCELKSKSAVRTHVSLIKPSVLYMIRHLEQLVGEQDAGT